MDDPNDDTHDVTIESAPRDDDAAVRRLLGGAPPAVPADAWELEQNYDSEARLGKIYYISSEGVIVVSVSNVSEEQMQRIVDAQEPALKRAEGVISRALIISIIEEALEEVPDGPATPVRMH
jgi:hypothetical protein